MLLTLSGSNARGGERFTVYFGFYLFIDYTHLHMSQNDSYRILLHTIRRVLEAVIVQGCNKVKH